MTKNNKRRVQCKRCRNLGHTQYFKDFEALDEHIERKHGVQFVE